jgi:HK97 family phage portal protein
MQLHLGPIDLSIKRRGSPQDSLASSPAQALPNVAFSSYPIPTRYYYNAFDSPRTNLLFIRETVSACMHARSEAVGHGIYHLYRKRNSSLSLGAGHPAVRDVVQNHPLERLLVAPNPLLDMPDILELVSQWLDATGNAIILKVRDDRGIVRELWPLPTLNFDIERGDDGLPTFYRFQPTNTLIAADDIIHIRRPDIRTAPLFGHAILSDLLDSAKADTALRLFQERYFANDSVPRAVLKWPAGAMMTQLQMNEIRENWNDRYAGPENGGRLAILPDGGEIEVLSSQAKELDFRNSKADLSDAIHQAFKVPKIVLGEVDNVNLANAETSYEVFMRDVVDNSLSRIGRALTRALAHEYSLDLFIEHENVLPESETQMLQRLTQLKETLTIDEQRALLAHAPLPNGAGNRFILGNALYDHNWQPTH